MTVGSSKFLGEFELIVVSAVLRLGDDAYGVGIIQEIEKRTEREVTIGALYATLSRLESKNYIVGRVGEATSERGGRAKRFFKITPEGELQLQRSISALNRMLGDLPGWKLGDASS